jgi:hypothetical protein
LAVYDSQDLIATIVEHAGKHHLFGPTGKYLGAYATRAAALAALPKVSR